MDLRRSSAQKIVNDGPEFMRSKLALAHAMSSFYKPSKEVALYDIAAIESIAKLNVEALVNFGIVISTRNIPAFVNGIMKMDVSLDQARKLTGKKNFKQFVGKDINIRTYKNSNVFTYAMLAKLYPGIQPVLEPNPLPELDNLIDPELKQQYIIVGND